MSDKKNELEEDEHYLIVYLSPEGNITWIASDEITYSQHEVFKLVNVVLVNPSIILRLVLKVELFLSSVLFYITSKVKK